MRRLDLAVLSLLVALGACAPATPDRWEAALKAELETIEAVVAGDIGYKVGTYSVLGGPPTPPAPRAGLLRGSQSACRSGDQAG
jgi:hypothetical protein